VSKGPYPCAQQPLAEGVPPLVSIVCTTFNQEKYIAECLNGFLLQETDFPVEIIVHDDASTDSTKRIIQAYAEKFPRLIFPMVQVENQFSQGKKCLLFPLAKARGKYLALCEGDDFWIDPKKLQRQVDFLEKNSQLSGCCTNFRIIDDHSNVLDERGWPGNKQAPIISQQMVLSRYKPKFCTTVLRATSLPSSFPDEYMAAPNGDNFLFALASRSGDIGYLDFVSACYRAHPGGIWGSKGKLEQYLMQRKTFLLMERYFDTDSEHSAIAQRLAMIDDNLLVAALKRIAIPTACKALSRIHHRGENPLKSLIRAFRRIINDWIGPRI